tara:strand:+ start:217 stop:495 length:279 start_codon:yes stop_codon:yes gene_type:complete
MSTFLIRRDDVIGLIRMLVPAALWRLVRVNRLLVGLEVKLGRRGGMNALADQRLRVIIAMAARRCHLHRLRIQRELQMLLLQQLLLLVNHRR